MAFNWASSLRILSSASLSSFFFIAAQRFASLAAGLSGPRNWVFPRGLGRGILLLGLLARGLAKLAPLLESMAGDPVRLTDTVEARGKGGFRGAVEVEKAARDAGREVLAAVRRLADEAVGWENLDGPLG